MVNISTILVGTCAWRGVAIILAVVPILRVCSKVAKTCAHDWHYKKYCISKEIGIRYLKIKPGKGYEEDSHVKQLSC
jgi:hypothetical protein